MSNIEQNVKMIENCIINISFQYCHSDHCYSYDTTFCHCIVHYNLLSVLLFNYHLEFYYLNEIFLEYFSKFLIPRLLLKVIEVGHTFLLVKLCFALKWLFHLVAPLLHGQEYLPVEMEPCELFLCG